MKQFSTTEDYELLPAINKLFWQLWLLKKGYAPSTALSIGQLMEVSFALPNTLHYDNPAERTTFNNSVEFETLLFAFDGDEPLDSYFYEVNHKLTVVILSAMQVKNPSLKSEQ